LRSLWRGKKYLGASVIVQDTKTETGNPGGELRVDVVFENELRHQIHSQLLSLLPEVSRTLAYELVSPGPRTSGKPRHKVFVAQTVEVRERQRWPEYHHWLLTQLKNVHANVLPIVQKLTDGVPTAEIRKALQRKDSQIATDGETRLDGSSSEITGLSDGDTSQGKSRIAPSRTSGGNQRDRGIKYWAVIADPKTYRIEDAVRELDQDVWGVARSAKVRRGDRLAIWKSLGGSDKRGIVAFAEVTSDPVESSDASNPFWVHPSDEIKHRVKVAYRIPDGLPLWTDGNHGGKLTDLSVSRGQGSGAFEISQQQWERVLAAAGGWPSNEIDLAIPSIEELNLPAREYDEDEASNTSAAKATSGRQRITQESAKKIGDPAERIALDFIKTSIPGATDVVWRASLGETPGWDIDYRKDGELVRVEVKGTIQDEFRSFELTRNERRAAEKYGDSYWLFLVLVAKDPRIAREQDPAGKINRDELLLEPLRWKVTFNTPSGPST